MSTLSKSLLGQERSELPGGSASKAFEGADSLMALVECTNSDAWLSLGLMFHLSVLPLTRQLACLSGFQWAKTLSGARAQRIEMLLLHEFHSRKFIVPDKLSNKAGPSSSCPLGLTRPAHSRKAVATSSDSRLVVGCRI